MATRYTRGPFLFTCCRVVHNKETNQLELAEVVGKKVRSEETVEEETKEEYKNTAVDLEEEEQSDLAGTICDFTASQTPFDAKQRF